MWETLNVMVYVGMFITAGFAIYGFSQLISSSRTKWEQELIWIERDCEELEAAIRNEDYARVPNEGTNSLGNRYGFLGVYGQKYFGEDALLMMLASNTRIMSTFKRSLEFWSKKRWKLIKAANVMLVVFVLFAVFGGRPDLNAWRARNIVDSACTYDLARVAGNLPSNFSFGTDYTDQTNFRVLAGALNALTLDASMAQGLDAKHFQYFYNEIALLRTNLDGTAQQDGIHNPRDIVDLNLFPFCVARL